MISVKSAEDRFLKALELLRECRQMHEYASYINGMEAFGYNAGPEQAQELYADVDKFLGDKNGSETDN